MNMLREDGTYWTYSVKMGHPGYDSRRWTLGGRRRTGRCTELDVLTYQCSVITIRGLG